MKRFAGIIIAARGDASRVVFARRLGFSHTFVRAMERGERLPSDEVLIEIAERLERDREELFLAAYCDRSPHLTQVLRSLGVSIPQGREEPVVPDLKPSDPQSLAQESEEAAETLDPAATLPAAEGEAQSTRSPF